MNFEFHWPLYIVIPLVILSYFNSFYFIIISIILLSIFQAAAAISLPGKGLPLAISPVVTYIVLIIPKMFLLSKFFPFMTSSGEFGMNLKLYRKRLLPLLLFGIFCALITPIDLFLFSGVVEVVSARERLGSENYQYLAASMSNVSQVGYILLWTYTACFIGYGICIHGLNLLKYCEFAIQVSFIITTLISLCQILSPGFYYDTISPLLHNNISMYQGDDQIMEDTGQQRLASSFPEPSWYGMYLSSIFPMFFWRSYFCSRLNFMSILNIILMLTCFLLIFLCTSSTGIITVVMFGICFVIFSISTPSILGQLSYRFLAFIFIGASTVLLFFSNKIYLMVDTGLESLLTKSSTRSFDERFGTITYAKNLAIETFGLGVGLGSTRTSSFLMNMFCTTGIIGLLLLIIHLITPFKVIFRIGELINRMKNQFSLLSSSLGPIYLFSYCWMLLCLFFAQTLALPDLNNPYFWLFSAIVISYFTVFTSLNKSDVSSTI